MLSNFEKVLQFCQTFGHHVGKEPSWPDVDTIRLRTNLIKEEATETIKALTEEDIPEIAKELADLLYVTYGTAVAFGIDLDAVFEEVHLSNMSKVGKDGKPILREDGKILKGPNYVPADIEGVLGWNP